MNVLDLFSGIGGFSLGLERAGFRTVAFCEIDSYCRAVLARHWPGVPILGDIRAVTADTDCERQLQQGGTIGQERRRLVDCGVEVICGGFPCQDISVAGKGAGLAGEKSGLWVEFARLIGALRPRYAIVENVSALCARGLGAVLGDLAALGYDAEWHCIPASYVGAPHRRDRVWILAYPHVVGRERDSHRRYSGTAQSDDAWRALAGASSPDSYTADNSENCARAGWCDASRQWRIEPDVGRVAHGVPSRVDRLRALGNAVVPQVVEVIGKAIMRHAYGG
jgi:DNA (cytosine-5)-methyltransferase 1